MIETEIISGNALRIIAPEKLKRSGVTGWRLRDLRRTIVSGMARLGVPPHVADKILNHRAGHDFQRCGSLSAPRFVARTEGSTRSLGRSR